jgi:hypothetical protein
MRRHSLAALAFVLAATAPAQNQGLVLANGTTGYLDVPYSPTLVPSGGITVEAWVTYNPALGAGWRFPTIVRQDPSPNVSSYFLRVEAGNSLQNRLLWWVSTTNGNYQANWFFPAGTLSAWTHVAGSYDGTTLRIFANGVQVAQAAGTGPILNTNGTLRIGSGDLSITGGETWNGEIDEVRVWPFARSAAAIASTMNLRLSSIPGEVTTWNLDGDGSDSSGTNAGTAVGTIAFAPSTLVQQAVPFPGLLASGYASGCTPTALAAASAVPLLGNGGFDLVCARAPSNGIGVAALSVAAFPVPVPVLGIDVFVDPSAGVLLTALANARGVAQVPFPIPNSPGVVGFTLYTQFAWLDACPTGFSASNALTAIVLP